MEFLSYIKTLLPSFTRDRLEEEARETHAQLSRSVLPSYQNATVISQKALRSVAAKNLDKLFSRNTPNIKASAGDNFIMRITEVLPKVIETQTTIQEILEKKFDKDIVLGGVTIFKVNVIQLQELVSFVARFSAKLLNYIYVVETAAVDADSTYVKDSITPGDIAWIEDKFLDFCRAVDTVGRGRKNVLEALDSLPEIKVGGDEKTDAAVVATLKDSQIDPLDMKRVANFSGSPILHIRTIVAEWQINRYNEMVELNRILELRALNLQRIQDKNPDAGLEDKIAMIQSRIDKTAAKMRKVEDSVK
jgi:hypothetical protein